VQPSTPLFNGTHTATAKQLTNQKEANHKLKRSKKSAGQTTSKRLLITYQQHDRPKSRARICY